MKLMMLDGNSIINRAFYGVRMLTTRDGTPTNAVYGFLNIYRKLLDDERPDAVCVAFDLKAPTFRHNMFDGYKAKRKPMPEELAVQMPILKDVLDAMNVRRCEFPGHEADDLIGTMARKCENTGWECVVVTGDKDSFQLISDTTKVLHVKSRMGQTETKLYDTAAFFEEYGFEPLKIVDLKALMGDASDNIPGVAGVGEKTAMELVRKFGTVDEIYAGIDSPEIKESVRKKLTAGRESAEMSRELALIERDAPVELDPDDCAVRPVDNDRLFELFKVLEFAKLTERFGLTPPGESAAEPEVFTGECVSIEIDSDDAARDMAAVLSAAESVGVMLSGGLDMIIAENDGTAYIIRRGAPGYEAAVKSIFSASVKKTGSDVKNTMRLLIAEGRGTDGWVFDTALAAYLLDPTASDYSIGRLTERWCGFSLMSGVEDSGQLTLLDDASHMAELLSSAAALSLLKEKFEKELSERGMTELYYNIELPLCRVLADMEDAGMLVDRDAIASFGVELAETASQLEKQIFALADGEFNINSPKQLGTVLFEKLMLPAPKKTKTGWSTSADVLEKLRGKHEIIPLILNYRQLTKLKSTYCDGLLKVISKDGRIHTNFQMTVTATGRLSSTEPNLQNIPVRRELGGEIRKMFVAPEGKVLVDADYSQIELRLLAHISGDETMINAFKNGEDIHTVTAAQVLGIPQPEVTSAQRSSAKAVNFGIVYGISAFSLSQDIGVSVAEARRYMDGYLEKYHGVREYMKSVVEDAKNSGYVATLYGRRRPLPELKSSNRNIASFGERVALNAPIQGTAADIMKIAMINVFHRLEKDVPTARLVLQVHDELIVECVQDDAEKVSALLREEMEKAASLKVPLTADTSVGKTWYDAK